MSRLGDSDAVLNDCHSKLRSKRCSAHARLSRTQELHIVTVTALAANKRVMQRFAWPRHRLRFFDREQSSCAPRYLYERCEHVQETGCSRRRDTGAAIVGMAVVAVDCRGGCRLTSKPPFFFLSSSSRRQWCAGSIAFRRRQTHIAFVAERVELLQCSQ